MQDNKGNIILYQSADGTANIEVTLANDTVWLTADQMAELFQRDRSTVQRHIKRIYQDNELTPDATCAFFAQVQKEGSRQVERNVPAYNLDMIISVGYRVKSHRSVSLMFMGLREHKKLKNRNRAGFTAFMSTFAPQNVKIVKIQK